MSSELVKYLEDKDIEFINKDWFYHASIYERKKYESILTKVFYLMWQKTVL